MFKFNFSSPEDGKNPDDEDKEDIGAAGSHAPTDELKWLPANEVFPPANLQLQDKPVSIFVCHGYQLQHVNSVQVTSAATEDDITESETLHSDLIPAKYEGGLKIWECTIDLANYLISHKVDFHRKRVLDLGCGAGILGILAMHAGASVVHFQDYNSSVVTAVTIPNVLLNSSKLQVAPETKFFSGDWGSLAELLSSREDKYDMILTSETIYNPHNHLKLLNVFNTCLKPHGVIFLAAKTYYFGVGGGTRQFEELLKKDGTFCSNVCWKCLQGVQREILHITHCDSQDMKESEERS